MIIFQNYYGRTEKLMFFICGINQEEKELGSFGPYICGACGSYGRYRVYITYMCLSLFFIPIFKWSKKYYVQTTCCQSLYELNPEIGKRIQRGESVDIRPEDMTLIRRGTNGYRGWQNPPRRHVCPACGYETEEDFAYCPKCGTRMEDR